MSYYLQGIDFEKHNDEQRRVWEAFHSGKPVRPPMVLGINPRIYLLSPALNTRGITFEQYSEDPDLMAWVQMRSQHYVRHHMLQDAEMGLPKDGWTIYPDFQNYYEAAWFGAPVEYRDGQVPDTRPILNADNKRMLFDRGIPHPTNDGLMGKMWRFYDHMTEHRAEYLFEGVPVAHVNQSGVGTDGPFTIACNLRGATEMCLEVYEDPDYVHELLRFITQATVERIKAMRVRLGQEERPKALGFADDSIELLSVDMYRELVLPYHKMLIEELAGEGPHWIHLCGNVDRHMPTIKRELNVSVWDAGFPMDYAAMRKALGPGFLIQTGPRVSLLLHGTPDEVAHETRVILESGIADGGRFILREANNLSPGTPTENVAAMYEELRRLEGMKV